MLGAALNLGCGSESKGELGPLGPPEPQKSDAFIAFEHSGTLSMGLREEQTLSVFVSPAEHQEVNFVLLGDSLDATLDHAAVEVDKDGHASVVLRSPNQSTTFTVRTWIMRGPADELTVAAVGDGHAPVEIVPIYKGNRVITDWSASIVARATCADVSPLLPGALPDALEGHALAGEPLIIKEAPVGPSLAVTVRAGEFAWGCSDAHDLVVGETMKVKVNVIDKPIVVGETNLDVNFILKPDPIAYSALLKSSAELMADALLPKNLEAGSVLLNAMASRVPESMSAAFADARLNKDWDNLASTHLEQQAAPFNGNVTQWLLTNLAGEPSDFVATLRALSEVPGTATLSPVRFGSVPAHKAGMPLTHLASLDLDAGDVMHLGASMYWLPSRYMSAVITNNLLQDQPEGTTMADLLSQTASCDVLGQTLGGFATCDAACMAGLCHEALATRWEDTTEVSASSGNIGRINIAAAVTTTVDDKAVPVSFQGSWLGSITDGVQVAKISKAELTAQASTPPSP